MEFLKLTYDYGLRLQFLLGKIQKKWRREYPHIFDDEDLRLALSQPKYHFGEWLVAIHYAKKG